MILCSEKCIYIYIVLTAVLTVGLPGAKIGIFGRATRLEWILYW